MQRGRARREEEGLPYIKDGGTPRKSSSEKIPFCGCGWRSQFLNYVLNFHCFIAINQLIIPFKRCDEPTPPPLFFKGVPLGGRGRLVREPKLKS